MSSAESHYCRDQYYPHQHGTAGLHGGLEDALAQKPHEVVPYKLLPAVEESVKQVVLSRLRLFNQQQG